MFSLEPVIMCRGLKGSYRVERLVLKEYCSRVFFLVCLQKGIMGNALRDRVERSIASWTESSYECCSFSSQKQVRSRDFFIFVFLPSFRSYSGHIKYISSSTESAEVRGC